jgi:hypothetical protein
MLGSTIKIKLRFKIHVCAVEALLVLPTHTLPKSFSLQALSETSHIQESGIKLDNSSLPLSMAEKTPRHEAGAYAMNVWRYTSQHTTHLQNMVLH